MATKRIIAYYMHEDEQAAARKLVKPDVETDSFLMASADETAIEKLEAQGLVVQVLDEGAARPPLRKTTRAIPAVPLRADAIDETGVNYYVVETQGPLFDGWRSDLDAAGVRILERLSPSSYSARLSPEQARAVGKMPFIRSMRLYGLEEDLDLPPRTRGEIPSPFGAPVVERRFVLHVDDRRNKPALLDWLQSNNIVVEDDTGRRVRVKVPDEPARIEALSKAPGVVNVRPWHPTYDVRVHEEDGRQKVTDWLQQHGATIDGVAGRKIRARIENPQDVVPDLAALPEVAAVDEFTPPDIRNDVARQLIGIDRGTAPPMTTLTLTGADQIVGVADTGLDDSHPDFHSRIVGLIPRGRPNDASDPDGHGTHVAGSVVGDGSASGGAIRGAAPKAKLFFQSVLDANDELGGLPLDLHELFDEAYKAGARIHNNSWGAATRGRYTGNAVEVDDFVVNHPDMLIVVAAGNEGVEATRVHSQKGFVDWLSIGSPASAKNALTVGASRSSRNHGEGYSNLTYGAAWPGDFPNTPIRNEKISGNPDCLAAFSSRGPCDDYRIKPDLVAPGTDILSTRSAKAPKQHYWAVDPQRNKYAYMGGTSMAAPIVAGCAALVREYYDKQRHHQPSAALLKATLINGTQQLRGPDAVADHSFTPNYHQGFGRIDMSATVPDPSLPAFQLAFADASAATRLDSTGSRRRLKFTVATAGRVRICVAWTDPVGRSVQNSLALLVQHVPTKQKWIGNPQVPQSLTSPDPTNNVIVVRLDNAQPGEYLVQVSAYNLAKPPQEFALVVTGKLTSDQLTPVAG